ncbi:hypothetical protein BC829DRAFT_394804 [Chytridium lagenaria]|nr:hypothetical protein BC829DRAFT_394804 [Chytridium lagenaria]
MPEKRKADEVDEERASKAVKVVGIVEVNVVGDVDALPNLIVAPEAPLNSGLPYHCTAKVLRKGVVWLQNYIPISHQLHLITVAKQLNIFHPSHLCKNEKARSIHMMTLSAKASPLPQDIVDLHTTLSKLSETLTETSPTHKPSQCVVLHYPPNPSPNRLSLHDEQGSKGCVVSVSIGDTAVFAFKPTWKKSTPLTKIELKSGDARGIVHGVERILDGTAPGVISEVLNGRLNFNVREK